MVYSLLLMAVPSADCAVVAQLDRALDSDSKGQRFESPRPHQKAAVLDSGLFLLSVLGPAQTKSPSPAPRRRVREGLSCLLGVGGLTERAGARAGAVNAIQGHSRGRQSRPKQRGSQLTPASAGIACPMRRPLLRCDQQRSVTERGLQPGLQAVSDGLQGAVYPIVCPD